MRDRDPPSPPRIVNRTGAPAPPRKRQAPREWSGGQDLGYPPTKLHGVAPPRSPSVDLAAAHPAHLASAAEAGWSHRHSPSEIDRAYNYSTPTLKSHFSKGIENLTE